VFESPRAYHLPAAPSTRSLFSWPAKFNLRSWTWPGHEGTILKVRVHSSGDQVRLLLNGREITAEPVSVETKFKADFDVPYEAGELKAVALAEGNQLAELAFKTVGKPAKLRLRAERQSIRRNRNDLAYVTTETRCPTRPCRLRLASAVLASWPASEQPIRKMSRVSAANGP
jgi:beta-galactosidase